ncbi:FG-GAP repeat domain-containing protein [Paraburkholderia sp.]|jgi:hypothetical protein|uniref:FG-GAP repeat domain-containing protein n=1 Tax=Paraburkholderia sp. TaxID=1926495 RepID=UPI003C7DFC10
MRLSQSHPSRLASKLLLISMASYAATFYHLACDADPLDQIKTVPGSELELSQFAQSADVNGDGVLDKCVVAGAGDKRFLSCTLGNKSGTDVANTGTFVSQPGTDFGDPPRVLVDVNGDGRADFCRNVRIKLKSLAGKPQIYTTAMRCMLANATAFSMQDTDPNKFTKKPISLTLYAAPDGTAIKFFTNSADGSWEALGTDSNGHSWKLEGESTKNGQAIGTGMRLRTGSKAVLAENYHGQEGLILNESVNYQPDNTLEIRIAGVGGYETYKGFDFSRQQMNPQTGYSSVSLHTWDCVGLPENTPSCEHYYSGKQYKADVGTDKIAWDGTPPSPLDTYWPDQQTPLLNYFQPVLTAMAATTGALVLTGVPWFDSQQWYTHSSQDWASMQEALSASGQHTDDLIDFVAAVAGAGIVTVGALAAAPVVGIIGAGVGLFSLAGMVFVSKGSVYDDELNACKSANYKPEGCKAFLNIYETTD